ncbi:unnamed protein product [Gadus morhua 'NCC']
MIPRSRGKSHINMQGTLGSHLTCWSLDDQTCGPVEAAVLFSRRDLGLDLAEVLDAGKSSRSPLMAQARLWVHPRLWKEHVLVAALQVVSRLTYNMWIVAAPSYQF